MTPAATPSSIEPGDAAANVLRAAYSYAVSDGHAQVDTALVLVAAARNDRTHAAPVLGTAVAGARARLRPAAGVAGPRDRADDAGGRPVVPGGCAQASALREARWWVLRDSSEGDRAKTGPVTAGTGGPVWSAGVGAALDRATEEAEAAGVRRIGVPHLLLGLLDDPSVRDLADRVELDVGEAAGRVADVRREPDPYTSVVDLIASLGATDTPMPRWIGWLPRAMSRLAARDSRLGGPVLAGLELEVMRQAVLLGQVTVQSSAVLLALLSLDEQLAAVGRQLRADLAPHNRGGAVLTAAGIDPAAARRQALGIVTESDTVPAGVATERLWQWGKPADPMWSVTALRVMDRAGELARARGHGDIGTSHCLAALLEQAQSSAGLTLLSTVGVDPAALRDRIDGELSRS